MHTPLPHRLGRFLAALALATCFVAIAIPSTQLLGQEPAKPSSPPAAVNKFNAAVRLQGLNEFELASNAWSGFLTDFASDPLVPQAYLNRGFCKFNQKDFTGAKSDFEALVQNYPKFEMLEQALYNLALADYNLGLAGGDSAKASFTSASATFAKQLAQFPKGQFAPQAKYYEAEALYHAKDLTNAIKSYREFKAAYEKDALLPDVLYALGVAEGESNDAKAAEATFQAFLKGFPKHALASEVELRLATALLAQKRYAEAEPYFAKVAEDKTNPNADFALFSQASCLFETKAFDQAAELWTRVTKDYPKSTHAEIAKFNAGKAFVAAKKPAEAIASFREIAATQGKFQSEAAHWLTQSLLQTKEFDTALQTIDQAIAQNTEAAWKAPLALDRANVSN